MKFSILATAFLISGTLAQSAFAADYIACTSKEPQWAEINDNKLGASMDGPGVLINLKAKKVTWVATGSYLRLTGVNTRKGVMITRMEGPTVTPEAIVDLKRDSKVYQSLPPIYETTYKMTLNDSLGGKGYLTVELSGESLGNQTTGSGSWKDDHGSRETLQYCTTLIGD